MAPTSCLIVLTEALDANDRIVFQWNGREVLAEETFQRMHVVLEKAKADKLRVVVSIHGRLGQNVDWEASTSMDVRQLTRSLFSKWYTQAVQAHAALVRQRVMYPPFR